MTQRQLAHFAGPDDKNGFVAEMIEHLPHVIDRDAGDGHESPREGPPATRVMDVRTLDQYPLLARSIRNRFPYLDPLNHLQIELTERYRGGRDEERLKRGIHLTINGIAAGLRNSG